MANPKYRSHNMDILRNICSTFNCMPQDVQNLSQLHSAGCNDNYIFSYKGEKYIYRNPGQGTALIINRGREASVQGQVDHLFGSALVSFDVCSGWKISHYIEGDGFSYKKESDVKAGLNAIRKLHCLTPKIKWDKDIKATWLHILRHIPHGYNVYFADLPNFKVISKKINKIYKYSEADGVKKCLIHGDCRDANIILSNGCATLIDWEYAGYGDPGIDIGSFVCGGSFSQKEVDEILFYYFNRKPNIIEKRHFYAYIALFGYEMTISTTYSSIVARNKDVLELNKRLRTLSFKYASLYSDLALKLYSL